MSEDDKTDKNPVGRPTEYDPRFCEMLVQHMAEGLSFESFGGVDTVDVCKSTLYVWLEKHPEFMDAKQRAISKCRLWWERTGLDGLWNTSERDGPQSSSSKSFNTGVWVFNMKNRFKDEWKEKHEIEHTNNPDNPPPKVVLYIPKNGREAPTEPPKAQVQPKKKAKKKK